MKSREGHKETMANAAQNTANTNNDGQKARRFSPIFDAVITPGEIVFGTTKTGNPFVTMKGSTVARDGKEDQTRTVMAFNNQLAVILDALEVGTPVKLAVQYDGGSLKAIGFPRVKEPAADAA